MRSNMCPHGMLRVMPFADVVEVTCPQCQTTVAFDLLFLRAADERFIDAKLATCFQGSGLMAKRTILHVLDHVTPKAERMRQ